MKIFAVGIGFFLILAMILLVQKDWGHIAEALCVFYAICTGVFFLAQLAGFVISQTNYSDEVEAPKFTLLENEEKEWGNSLSKN